MKPVAVLILLFTAVLAVYYPVFTTDYLYADEAVQLWRFKENLNFNTSVSQGRFLTYKLFVSVFNHIHTIHDVRYARLFSLTGWLAVLPIWHKIISSLVIRAGWPPYITLLAMTYLVSMPAFAISIGWAACMELFIANTAGLIAGYCLYIYPQTRVSKPLFSILLLACSVLLGLVSLFTYQNGFGCFLLPFLVQLIADKKITGKVSAGAGAALLIYGLYFLLFRFSLSMSGMSSSTRAGITSNPADKLLFFFNRPLSAAFHFTWLFNEKSIPGMVMSLVLMIGFGAYYWKKLRPTGARGVFLFAAAVFALLLLIYLPSLIVIEKYPSNRTMLALSMAVFFLAAGPLISIAKTERRRVDVVMAAVILFVINGAYNFHYLFIRPLKQEYAAVAGFLDQHYGPAVKKIYVIMPPEDAFHKRNGTSISWDEFGRPSTAMPWTPDPLVRQIVFEKTGRREIAESLAIDPIRDDQRSQLPARGADALLLDIPALINVSRHGGRQATASFFPFPISAPGPTVAGTRVAAPGGCHH